MFVYIYIINCVELKGGIEIDKFEKRFRRESKGNFEFENVYD